MKISRILASVSIVFLLLLPAEGFNPNPLPTKDKKIVFEEVGQHNDGGMAVTVLVVNHRAYVCEFDKGLEILDISDPAHIVKLGQIEDTEQARGIEIVGDIAYVSCNTNGLKLFNIINPSQPVYLGQYGDRDGDPHQFLAAGDIGYLTEWHGGFDIIDISNPLKPVRMSQHKDDGLAFSVDIVGSHAFVTGYKDGLKILDISDSKNPVLIGDFNNGGETNALHVVDGKAYVCDKLQGLEILDVSDLAHPRLLGTFKGGGSTVGVHVVEDLAFLINWELGLEAIDISTPSRPVRIGSFFDGGRPNGFQVVGDLIYMADGSDGLEIIRYTQQKDFPVLTGAYLGQKPPGMTPDIFAPGIITTDISEGCSGWGNDMEYFIFQRWIDRKPRLYIMNQSNGIWSAPELIPFLDRYQAGDFTIAPDGKTLIFASNILIDDIGAEGEGGNIWTVEKTKNGWIEPKHIGLRINTKYHESYPCLTANGNIYFFSRRPGGYGDSDLYMSEFIGGEYRAPVNLGPKLNTEYHEWDTYTAPDESYMIYCSTKPDGLGEDDLYVTFKTIDGSWSDPVHMGNEINTEKSENRPYVSPDGKYLFYASTIRGNRDIYWVDARIIEKLKTMKHSPD